MSKEDQINLTSYANLFNSLKVLFKIQYLWNPYSQSVSTASTGLYLILVLRSSPFKVGGTVTTTKNDPPQLVLQQSQPETKFGPIGHTISFMADCPPLVLYGLLVIAPFLLAI
ncbi:hypothetical protein O181_123746 [Austropuccinia psidii MF-1]|uniref:Uncharacterized protein n=1 Tax=Austropuccinia psidii MF-1 TaxID=1389203 RepID=A0A9Q3Q3I8_9BASI|nr:hypothetical protein [Austropuccinia psidii MF-1]